MNKLKDKKYIASLRDIGINIIDEDELYVADFQTYNISNLYTMDATSYISELIFDEDKQILALLNFEYKTDSKFVSRDEKPFNNGITYFKFIREFEKSGIKGDYKPIYINTQNHSTFGLFNNDGLIEYFWDKGEIIKGNFKSIFLEYQWAVEDEHKPKYEDRVIFKDKENIDKWLKANNINDYTINDDLTVDVNGSVSLKQVTIIPVQFGIVHGDFRTDALCDFRDLSGFPREVAGNFYLWAASLLSLKGGPIKVGGHYDIMGNFLTSFEHCAKYVGGDFKAQDNRIKTLEYLPEYVGSNLELAHVRMQHIDLKCFTNIDFKGQLNISSKYGEKFKGLESLYKQNDLILTQDELKHILLKQQLDTDLNQKPIIKKMKI